MTIFEIIAILEATSGFTVSIYTTSTEMNVQFQTHRNGRSFQYTFTDEEVSKTDIEYWSSLGGNVKFKYKSER